MKIYKICIAITFPLTLLSCNSESYTKQPGLSVSVQSAPGMSAMFKHFYRNGHKYLLQYMPFLKKQLKNISGRKDRNRIIFKHFETERKRLFKKMAVKAMQFEEAWNRVKDKYLTILCRIHEMKWLPTDRIFTAELSLVPICPRDIRKRSFIAVYQKNIDGMIRTAIHEIAHFAFFIKWQEVFPRTKKREYDHPYLIWHLSEIVQAVVLNDKRMLKHTKKRFPTYPEYHKAIFKGKPLLSYIQEIYDNRTNFADFLKKSIRFLRKNKKEIPTVKDAL